MQEFHRICAKVCAAAKYKKQDRTKTETETETDAEAAAETAVENTYFLKINENNENKRNGDCKHGGLAKKGNKMPANGNEIAIAGPHSRRRRRRRRVAKR